MKKEEYIEMIHNPVILNYCRLFTWDWVEYFSRNKPTTIVSIWLPVVIFLMYLGFTTSYPDAPFMDKYITFQSE